MAVQLTAEAIIKAVDAFSSPVKAMAGALDAFANKADRRIKSVSERFGDSGNKLVQFGQRATAVSALSFTEAIKSYADYEEKLVKIKKVFDGPGGGTPFMAAINKNLEFDKIEKGLLAMSAQIPVTLADLATLAQTASGAGMNKSAAELLEFTRIGAEFTKAFDMNAKEAAEALAGLKIQFGLTLPQLRLYGDLINHLGNETLAKEKDIVDVMSRVAGTAATFGEKARNEMTALASTLLSFKVPASTAAVAINNLVSRISVANKPTREAFEKLGLDVSEVSKRMSTDFSGAVMSILQSVNKLPAEERLGVLKQMFGDYAARQLIKAASGGAEEYAKQLGLIADQSKYAGSMNREFQTTIETMNSRLALLNNQLGFLSKTLVQDFFPQISSVIGWMGSFAKTLADMPGWVKSLAIFGSVMLALGPVVLLVGSAFAALSAGIGFIAGAIGAPVAGVWALIAAFTALITGIGLLSPAGVRLVEFFGTVASAVGGAFMTALQKAGELVFWLTTLVTGLGTALGKLAWSGISGLWNKMTSLFASGKPAAPPVGKTAPSGPPTLSDSPRRRESGSDWLDRVYRENRGLPAPEKISPPLNLPPLQTLFQEAGQRAAARLPQLDGEIARLSGHIERLSQSLERIRGLEDKVHRGGGKEDFHDSTVIGRNIGEHQLQLKELLRERETLIRDFAPGAGGPLNLNVDVKGEVQGRVEVDVKVEGPGVVTDQRGGDVSGTLNSGRSSPDTGAR